MSSSATVRVPGCCADNSCKYKEESGCIDMLLITLIQAILNSKTFFVTPFGREMEADTIKRSFRRPDEHSDFLVAYRVYCLWRSNCEAGSWSAFTRKHFLSHIVGPVLCFRTLTPAIADKFKTAPDIDPDRGAEGSIHVKPH